MGCEQPQIKSPDVLAETCGSGTREPAKSPQTIKPRRGELPRLAATDLVMSKRAATHRVVRIVYKGMVLKGSSRGNAPQWLLDTAVFLNCSQLGKRTLLVDRPIPIVSDMSNGTMADEEEEGAMVSPLLG